MQTALLSLPGCDLSSATFFLHTLSPWKVNRYWGGVNGKSSWGAWQQQTEVQLCNHFRYSNVLEGNFHWENAKERGWLTLYWDSSPWNVWIQRSDWHDWMTSNSQSPKVATETFSSFSLCLAFSIFALASSSVWGLERCSFLKLYLQTQCQV